MPDLLITETKEVFNAKDHQNETGYSNYTGTSWQHDEWRTVSPNANSAVLIRNAIMGNYDESDNGMDGRVYTDENNAMRFRANLGTKDQENDYYCVAMGEGFAQAAADYCGVDLYGPYNSIANWGFTFNVELVDKNNQSHYINVIMVGNKALGEGTEETNPWRNNTFTPHSNSVIEFMTGEKGDGFNDDISSDVSTCDNLDYSKLLGNSEDEIEIRSISAYKNGFFVTQTLSGDTWTVDFIDHQYGIPVVPTTPIFKFDEYCIYVQNNLKYYIDKEGNAKEFLSFNQLCINLLNGDTILSRKITDIMESIRIKFKKAEEIKSPIVLDLDGDGVETIAMKDGVQFDHNSNGFKEKSGWVSADDGLLVNDINNNGIIDNGSELFGNNTLLSSGEKAENGFAALADFDENADGIIDASDSIFESLKVWKDADADGTTDDGELISLADAGVASINTGFTNSSLKDENGNEHKQVGSFTKTDGTTGNASDIWFNIDAMLSTPTEMLDETDEIAALPNLMGFGNAYSLHQAMLRDETGHIKELVEKFSAETDEFERKLMINDIIFAWIGVEDVDPNSRAASQIYGNVIGDARKLEVLEALFGEDYVGTWCWGEKDSNPHGKAAPVLLQVYDEISSLCYE